MNWQSFPNPSEKRKNWICLNGEWLLNGRRIVVPFCPESKMSKYAWEIEDRRNMVYEKSFFIPADFEAEHANRLLLHLDGVDQTCTVIINQKPVGGHSDGYTKAVFDVTGYVSRDKENFLQIIACDTLSHEYPYGKQKYKRGGMWYTPCSGVWKSVWLEAVPEDYIKDLRIDTDLESFSISVDTDLLCDHSLRLKILAPEIISGDKEAGSTDFLDEEDEYWDCIIDTTGISNGDRIKVNLSELKSTEGRDIPVRHWSPDEPWIYQMYISTGFDTVKTYFALRTVRIAEVGGQPRVLLNDEPVFLNGLLDQGYYTESLYLPKTEVDYEKDILGAKELGFNLLRKHIKTESDWFYYYCDIHGMLVMQDMVNTGHYRYITDTVLPTIGIFISDDRRRYASKKRRSIFKEHVLGVAAQVHNHPSVIMFTIFNEGWGQHDSDDYYDLLKAAEPDRIIDSTSGWFMGRKSDLDSRHIYFKLREVTHKKGFEDRPVFISECGGYSYAVEGHLFNPSRKYGYGACDSPESLTDRIEKLYDEMIVPGIQNGVCGSIYTQVSDVEDEINGIYTYDREVCKVNRERMKKISEKAAKAIRSKGLLILLLLVGTVSLAGCDGSRKSGRRTPTPTPVVNVRDPYASIGSDKESNLVPVPTLFPDGKRRDTTPTPRPTPTDTPVPTEGISQGTDKQPTSKPKKTPTPTPKPTNTPRPTKAPKVTLTPTPEPTATPTPGVVDYELIPATPTPRI